MTPEEAKSVGREALQKQFERFVGQPITAETKKEIAKTLEALLSDVTPVSGMSVDIDSVRVEDTTFYCKLTFWLEPPAPFVESFVLDDLDKL
jgi:hypothetical protein